MKRFFILSVLVGIVLVSCGHNQLATEQVSLSTSTPLLVPTKKYPVVQTTPNSETISPMPCKNSDAEIKESNQLSSIVFGEEGGRGYTIQNLNESVFSDFQNSDNIVSFIDWDKDGENLIGLTSSGYANLNDKLGISNWLYTFDEGNTKPWLYPPLLSPDKKKVVYLFGRGQFMEGMLLSVFEFQDMVVKSIENNSEEYTISLNGGARNMFSSRYGDLLSVWSPDSEWIVFSDYDDNGNYQFYISRFDGKAKRQITNRSVNGEDIFGPNYSVAWSPSSDRLAISFEDGDLQTKIITLADEREEKTITDAYPLWWTNDEELILRINDKQVIALYNPFTKQTTSIIDLSNQTAGYFSPFENTTKIGFFCCSQEDYQLHVYDIQSKNTELFPKIKFPTEGLEYWPKYHYWFIIPNNPLEINCTQ